MISICIPVYNFNVCKLVNDLTEQGNRSGVPFEIIIIDDGSDAGYRRQNASISQFANYIELDRNIGRSRIRNLFPGYAGFSKLLFMDCDSEIVRSDFLEQYLIDIKKTGVPVICGGRINNTNIPAISQRLRWKFGVRRESLTANVRNKSPYRYFMTNNFLVDLKVFDITGFDERLINYGYEDTLFAYRLMKNGIAVIHTDNPVMHSCNETNTEFLGKIEQSISNLGNILEYVDNDPDFIDNIRILRVYDKLKRIRLTGTFRFIFRITRAPLRFLLKSGFGNLFLFDIYKLGLFTNGYKKMIFRNKIRKII
jgi:hypothetical protein